MAQHLVCRPEMLGGEKLSTSAMNAKGTVVGRERIIALCLYIKQWCMEKCQYIKTCETFFRTWLFFGVCKTHFGPSQASGLVSCTQHVFIYQMRSRTNGKINSTDKQAPLPPMCDGEPRWMQQGAVAKHTTESGRTAFLDRQKGWCATLINRESSINIHASKFL